MFTTDKAFGDKIKLFRNQRGWKQEFLADKANLSQSEISKIEAGKVKGEKETILKLADALEVSPEILSFRNTSLSNLFNQSPLLIRQNAQALPISAYFASALTGLTDSELAEIVLLDEKIDEICQKFDGYQLVLYRPRTVTSPVDNPDVPDRTVYEIDQERVASADVIFLAALFPSLGAGMELQIALQSCSSIILLKKTGQRLSRMVSGCPAIQKVVEFDDLDDLEEKVFEALNVTLPAIAEFRAANPQLQDNSNEFELGNRVNDCRKKLGFSQEQLARMIGVDVSYIELLETKSQRIINPSLQILNRIAKSLLTSVSYLITGQDIDSTFLEHFDVLKSFSEEVDMSVLEFNELCEIHTQTYQNDLSVVGVSNRAEIGDKKYWKEQYAKLKGAKRKEWKTVLLKKHTWN